MKYQIKISGIKSELDEALIKDYLERMEADEIQYDHRPGGWIIAKFIKNNEVIKRSRFFYSKTKSFFNAKLTDSNSLDFYGEKSELSRGAQNQTGGGDYTAQFPGKVRKVLVSEGTAVDANVPLLMVEAMKMEFAIRSGSAGVVKKMRVTEGTILTPGQVLLDFEEKKA